MVMDTVTADSASATADAKKPDILAWFDWAERLTTGLGQKSELSVADENNFDAVLLSLLSSLHNKPGADTSGIQRELKSTGVRVPEKLAVNAGSVVAIETITLFMLERLATRDDERAFDIAEDLRSISRNGIFASQLQIFQMGLAAGNETLRPVEPFGNKDELVANASRERSFKPDSFAASVNQAAKRMMHSYFKPAQLNAA